ncbi:hypothetical protein M404DRAFT_994368 [Pisolithus tinctorius Marx 270]|uniref:Uncharacterized protein n=1 Tax=Pisolithus tinctorius Marx 270 TaxID=870435 RepID=A0A0C3PSK4_PISTI|nr:hypothetical protein M404DRAFT_994368 [Pisolithus tinctorius Marx 270]
MPPHKIATPGIPRASLLSLPPTLRIGPLWLRSTHTYFWTYPAPSFPGQSDITTSLLGWIRFAMSQSHPSSRRTDLAKNVFAVKSAIPPIPLGNNCTDPLVAGSQFSLSHALHYTIIYIASFLCQKN